MKEIAKFGQCHSCAAFAIQESIAFLSGASVASFVLFLCAALFFFFATLSSPIAAESAQGGLLHRRMLRRATAFLLFVLLRCNCARTELLHSGVQDLRPDAL